MSRGLISYRRLVGSCSKMALDGSIVTIIHGADHWNESNQIGLLENKFL